VVSELAVLMGDPAAARAVACEISVTVTGAPAGA
jgi:hypothetical protein